MLQRLNMRSSWVSVAAIAVGVALFTTSGISAAGRGPRGASGGQKALGTIDEAERARLGTASAVSGTTVYVGDVVATDGHGTMRLRLGKGQLLLSASSSASFEEHAGLASVTLARGSATFSLPDPTQFELETLAGTLRGSGTKATRGQVAISNSRQIIVTASHGDLVLEYEGDFYTIAEGKSFRVVTNDPTPSRTTTSASKNASHPKSKLLFFRIAGGPLTATSFAPAHPDKTYASD